MTTALFTAGLSCIIFFLSASGIRMKSSSVTIRFGADVRAVQIWRPLSESDFLASLNATVKSSASPGVSLMTRLRSFAGMEKK